MLVRTAVAVLAALAGASTSSANAQGQFRQWTEVLNTCQLNPTDKNQDCRESRCYTSGSGKFLLEDNERIKVETLNITLLKLEGGHSGKRASVTSTHVNPYQVCFELYLNAGTDGPASATWNVFFETTWE